MTKDVFVPPVGVVIWTFDGGGVMSGTLSQLTTGVDHSSRAMKKTLKNPKNNEDP